jgi:hypothetical protein
MSVITRPTTKRLEISKTAKSVLAIAGVVISQLVIVYALIPAGVYLWRICTGC